MKNYVCTSHTVMWYKSKYRIYVSNMNGKVKIKIMSYKAQTKNILITYNIQKCLY